ncbi:MAG TPA: PAS domain S-box protein [Chthoniobacterales bacterium]
MMSLRSKKSAPNEASEQFRLIIEGVSDYAIFMLDTDGKIVTWNIGAERIKGYPAEEIIGHHFSEFYAAEDVAARKPEQELERAKADGRVESEGWRRRKDGSRFWASAVITALHDKTGKLVGYAKVTRDLTDRKMAEERLRQSEEQFRRLVDGVEEYAIYMLDPSGRVATWNSGAEKIKRYRANEIIGKSFVCFYTPEDVAAGKPQHNLQMARKHGHIRDQGLRVRKDGSVFQAEVVITAVSDDEGNLRGFSKVTRDITEQVRTREMEAAKIAAEKASQAKDDFLAALSHELRTPLTPALAAASYLVHNAAKLPPEFGNDLEIIRRNIQLEARLIDDLLDLTRITRGKLELQLGRVDAHSAISDGLQMAKEQIKEKGLSLSTALKAERHFIRADAIRIQQVFWNLINNAVKFTGPGGNIQIGTRNDEKGNFIFEIADNGIGIEPGRRQKLFDAFEQGERSVTRQFGGLGLGLAIAKNLVDLHHGTISAMSEGLSQGATFTVTLEALPFAGNEVPESEAPKRPQKPLNILVVEDHGDTRQTLARLLGHFGHQIVVADSVETAMKAFRSQRFDALVSDIGLPDGTGYEIIKQAKRRYPIKSIALTGFGMEEDVRKSKAAGFDFHLTKPVDFAELRTVLNEIGSGPEE